MEGILSREDKTQAVCHAKKCGSSYEIDRELLHGFEQQLYDPICILEGYLWQLFARLIREGLF